MRWRLKALALQVLDRTPGGRRIHDLLQRHLTRSLPAEDDLFRARLQDARLHHRALQDHLSPTDARGLRLFEFGAGYDLLQPLALARWGVARQTVTDLHPLARLDLVRDAWERLGREDRAKPSGRRDLPPTLDLQGLHDLEGMLGIRYRAPVDPLRTGLAGASFDAVSSNNTLEHVPRPLLPGLLAECRRLLRPGGLLTLRIDYQDHYARFDPAIDVYHFLRYSPAAWRLWNPPSHHQNRLRHSDYLRLLERTGFRILRVQAHDPSPEEMERLRIQPLASHFRSYTPEQLAVRWGFFVVELPGRVRSLR